MMVKLFLFFVSSYFIRRRLFRHRGGNVAQEKLRVFFTFTNLFERKTTPQSSGITSSIKGEVLVN